MARLDPLVLAIGLAVIGAVLLVVVGGVLASTTGLLFVSGLVGAGIGLVLAERRDPETRVRIAISLAVAAVLIGALGTWLLARHEGGALGPIDYLWQTFGLLVPGEAALAALAALWGVRSGPIR